MASECPHGNRPGERCAPCVASGHGQLGDAHQGRYADPRRVTAQRQADVALAEQARKQLAARREVLQARARTIATRQQLRLDVN